MTIPVETKNAINWALQQTWSDDLGIKHEVTKKTSFQLVDNVRQYFNENNISYTNFSYDDLKAYL